MASKMGRHQAREKRARAAGDAGRRRLWPGRVNVARTAIATRHRKRICDARGRAVALTARRAQHDRASRDRRRCRRHIHRPASSSTRARGKSWIAKVPSTRGREAAGFLNGIRQGTDDVSAIATIVHGTTVGTNALLERKGGKAGVIATEGFRDVLEMRRRDRPQTWGLWGQFEPVVPRERRVEVRERVLADGTRAYRNRSRGSESAGPRTARTAAPRPSRSPSSTPTPMAKTSGLQPRRPIRSGRTPM